MAGALRLSGHQELNGGGAETIPEMVDIPFLAPDKLICVHRPWDRLIEKTPVSDTTTTAHDRFIHRCVG